MSRGELNLYHADRKVGRLFDERPMRFVYDNAWLSAAGARPISRLRAIRSAVIGLVIARRLG